MRVLLGFAERLLRHTVGVWVVLETHRIRGGATAMSSGRSERKSASAARRQVSIPGTGTPWLVYGATSSTQLNKPGGSSR